MKWKEFGKIKMVNADCIELLKILPDQSIDIAIVDPPYGIGASKPKKKPNWVRQINDNILSIKQSEYIPKEWDFKPPSKEYFDELIRVSKNQIIFGINYFTNIRDFGSGRIVWDKMNGYSDQYGCEIAYCSFNKRTDIVHYMWSGMIQGKVASEFHSDADLQIGNKRLNEKRIHPTQKPVKLYDWLLRRYATPGDKILDTHFGSGSLAIACHELDLEFIGSEIDKEYFDKAIKRVSEHVKLQKIISTNTTWNMEDSQKSNNIYWKGKGVEFNIHTKELNGLWEYTSLIMSNSFREEKNSSNFNSEREAISEALNQISRYIKIRMEETKSNSIKNNLSSSLKIISEMCMKYNSTQKGLFEL